MPAKKKTKKAKSIKVKHLTNALYWSIRIQTQVRMVLLSMDPESIIAIDESTLAGGGLGGNIPRVYNCPPA